MYAVRAAFAAISFTFAASASWAQDAAEIPVPEETPQAQILGGVAAVVNDEVISISDVVQRARLLLITLGVPASNENLQQALPRSLEELIDERLQLQKAAEFELEIAEPEVLSAVENLAVQNQTNLDGLYTSLQSQGVNPATLEDQMRAEIAWRRIMSGLYGSRIRISQLQIDGMIDRLSAGATEERYQLSEIFLFAPTEQDKQQALQGANVIVQQLRQGARFQLAAQQYSNAPTAAVGGDLGWVALTELEPEVQQTIQSITPPALTAPISVEDGVYIYAIRGKQDGMGGETDVDLRQVLGREDNQAELNALLLDQPSCDELETYVSNADSLTYANFGTVAEVELTDQIQATISSVPAGGNSEIITTANGPAVLFVCSRTQSGLQLPDRRQVEDRLHSQQLSMLSQRELRDLKRDATIIRR